MKKILITEDEESLREIFHDELESVGYNVSVAENGTQCLNLVEKEKFDLIIVDINLPDITGLELLTRIRKNDSEVPLMVCSAYDVKHDFNVWASNIKEYLPKPVDLDDLRNKIKKIIGE